MRTYSLYLSSTGLNKPNNTSNLAHLKWSINWKEIFGDRNVGECRVRFRFISTSSVSLNWGDNVGSLRASFQSNTSNSTNGLNLGLICPRSDFESVDQIDSIENYLDGNTASENGLSMIIPNNNTDLYVMLINRRETLMINVPEYQLWLYFDVDDEPSKDRSLFYPR